MSNDYLIPQVIINLTDRLKSGNQQVKMSAEAQLRETLKHINKSLNNFDLHSKK